MFWSYLDGSGGRPLVGILGSLGVWFLTCTSVCMVQDMTSEDEQRGGRRMENALASRLLRASWLSPEGSDYSEGSTSREDGQGKGAYLCGSGVSGLMRVVGERQQKNLGPPGIAGVQGPI